ncbi:ytbD [Symbiodinium sp. CCMP2456]|nr:ytbD [Symbiodinium sp. CCMP2456]
MSKEDPKSPKHLTSGPQANRVKVNPQPPNQLCGDVDTLPACENSSLLSMPPVCAGRRKASTEDCEEELSMNLLSREEIFIRTFPGTYWKAGASDEDMSPVRSGADAQGEEETEDAAGASTDLPLSHSPGGSVSANSLSASDHFSSPPATQRGDKLRESICPGPSSSSEAEPERSPQAQTSAEAEVAEAFGFELRALPDKLEDAPAIPARACEGFRRRWGRFALYSSGCDVASIYGTAIVPSSANHRHVGRVHNMEQGAPPSPTLQPVVQMTQVLAPPKMELSLSGACLDLLVAPGDVLLMRGSGRLAEIGNAGGFMGHVLVVTGKPREVLASSAEAGQLASLWPEKAQALWRIPTLESTRREQGLWEAESVIMVERLGRQLTLVGEVERDGDVCNFEPHEAVEIWQSPEELRGALRVDLMALVLSDMRKNQASWSATTAARAARSPRDLQGKVREAEITPARCSKCPSDRMALGSGELRTHVTESLHTACAIDAADKALLPATFGALADQLQVGPTQLAMLNFAQSIAFSLALPVWGSMMQFYTPRDLLAGGCFLWGFVTMLIATSSNYMVHFLLRLVMGAALAVVAPIGQAMLCDLVPEAERGWVFGLLQSISTALSVGVTFLTTGFARVLIAGVYGWRCIYALIGIASFFTVAAVVTIVPDTLAASGMNTKGRSWWEEQARVVQLVMQKPSFVIMVSQGVTGGIPWNGFAFLPLYFQLSGFNDFRAGEIMLYGGLGGMVGGLLGGWLGDRFHRCWPYGGRCVVAQLSVLLGSLFFVAVMTSPAKFSLVVGFFFAFHVASCWTPAAALRPICGEIVRDSRDRAQILALWIALEGIISSIFGAPLVGLISEAFGCKLGGLAAAGHDQSVNALRSALLAVALIPWALCGLAWPDPSLGAGFNPGDKISYWDLSCGTWVSGFVKERVVDGQGDVAVAYHLDIKPSANPQHVRRRLNEETVAAKAVDLIRRYVPLKADRALPGDLMRSMQRCYWSCIQQAPLVFRPVMTLPPQPMVINVPVGPSPPTASRPQSPQPQSSSRPRKTSSSHSNPAAPSPTMRPVPVFGHPPQSVSPSPVQMPAAAPQNLPVFAFPQNRSGGQLPVFAFPGREPGQPGQPPSSPSALPIFAPSGGLAGLGAVPGMALPQQLTPRTPRTPRDEQTSPTAQVASSPSSPSQPPQEPVQEAQDSEVEWMNLRKGITTSTEGFANEEEGLKEVLSPGDESIDFEEFSDIRNSDGAGPGLQDWKPLQVSCRFSRSAAIAAHEGDAWSHPVCQSGTVEKATPAQLGLSKRCFVHSNCPP